LPKLTVLSPITLATARLGPLLIFIYFVGVWSALSGTRRFVLCPETPIVALFLAPRASSRASFLAAHFSKE
jgi:hypothetical protein